MEKQNKGAIFKNENKSNEKHPDYRGKINWGGTEIEVSMWVNKSKEGKSYFSVSLQEPYKKMENSSDKMRNAPLELDDDLPF
jgi:uncharacterized protein (DUF736 family)